MYVNGDSFAFGEELDGSHPEQRYQFTDYKRKNCYSGIIADHYEIPKYINNSIPGGSNQRAYRTIIKDISKLITEYKPEEIFVTMSVSHCMRAEFHYDTHENAYWDFLAAWPPPENSCFYNLYNVLTKYYNHDYGWYNFNMMMILGIQNFLKINNVPYLLTTSMHHNAEYEREKSFVTPETYNQLDFNRYYMEPSFMVFNNSKNYPIGKSLHPLEEGHKNWAKHLIQIIDERNLFSTGDL